MLSRPGSNRCSLFLALAVAVANAATASGAIDGTLAWDASYGPCGDGPLCVMGNKNLDHDVLLRSIVVSVTGLPKGAQPETCIASGRSANPVYPPFTGGYSENFCWHAERPDHSEDWGAVIDLSATPLYLPKDTFIGCGGNLAGVTPEQASGVHFTCKIEYQNYVRGMPRYRTLRLPYFDMSANPDGSLPTTYYMGSDISALHVVGVNLFQSFGNDDRPGTLTNACLKWLRQGGAVVRQACFPAQSISPKKNYSSPPFLKVDWLLQAPDLLTATSRQSRPNTGSAFYAVVEIPSNIKPGPENTVRDYNNVPSNYLSVFCSKYLKVLKQPPYSDFLCKGGGCDDQVLLEACAGMFPRANCVNSNECAMVTQRRLPVQWIDGFTPAYLEWLEQNHPGVDANDAVVREEYTKLTGLGAQKNDARNYNDPQWTRDYTPTYLQWLSQNHPRTDANDAATREEYTERTGLGAQKNDLRNYFRLN